MFTFTCLRKDNLKRNTSLIKFAQKSNHIKRKISAKKGISLMKSILLLDGLWILSKKQILFVQNVMMRIRCIIAVETSISLVLIVLITILPIQRRIAELYV